MEAEAEAGCSLTFKSVDGKGNALYASALYILYRGSLNGYAALIRIKAKIYQVLLLAWSMGLSNYAKKIIL